jgi:heme exporter protein C
MKFVIMLAGVVSALVLMHRPGRIDEQKPQWWRWLVVASVTLTCILGIFPPLAGSITDVVVQHRADSTKTVPALVRINVAEGALIDARDTRVKVSFIASDDVRVRLNTIEPSADVIARLRRLASDRSFEISELVAIEPPLTMPYIVGLEERARILFFHVPMSWCAVIAYCLAMIAAVRYLRTGQIGHDEMSAATASVGTLFTILATTTGAVWAKFNWGTFWNWDPRQTSILLLLLIYAAYFLLRSSIDDEQRRARLSGVYAIIAFATVPFLMFVLPRLLPGLHPGSADDSNIGPLLSPRSDAINPTKNAVFGLALFSFTMVFAWLVNLRVRYARVERHHAELQEFV